MPLLAVMILMPVMWKRSTDWIWSMRSCSSSTCFSPSCLHRGSDGGCTAGTSGQAANNADGCSLTPRRKDQAGGRRRARQDTGDVFSGSCNGDSKESSRSTLPCRHRSCAAAGNAASLTTTELRTECREEGCQQRCEWGGGQVAWRARALNMASRRALGMASRHPPGSESTHLTRGVKRSALRSVVSFALTRMPRLMAVLLSARPKESDGGVGVSRGVGALLSLVSVPRTHLSSAVAACKARLPWYEMSISTLERMTLAPIAADGRANEGTSLRCSSRRARRYSRAVAGLR
eukprot:4692457-Pleurochrysis_carterae.AAC.4